MLLGAPLSPCGCSAPSGSCEAGRTRLLRRRVKCGRLSPISSWRRVPSIARGFARLFWDVPNDPRGELRWCLSKIRGLLGDPSHEPVKAEKDWVSIDASTIEVDALWVGSRAAAATSGRDLDLLKQLAAKFEGEFLEGFEADRIPLFEAWLIGERQRFQGLHADVLSRIIALLPRTHEALPYIRKRLDLLPCDEAAHRDLMATLGACGPGASPKPRPTWRRRSICSRATD